MLESAGLTGAHLCRQLVLPSHTIVKMPLLSAHGCAKWVVFFFFSFFCCKAKECVLTHVQPFVLLIYP